MAARRAPTIPARQNGRPEPPLPPTIDPANLSDPYVPPPPRRVMTAGGAAAPNTGSLTVPAIPGQDGVIPAVLTPTELYGDIGLTGLKRFSGHVYEEFLPQLWGNKAIQIYREMSDNDPVIGAMLFAIEQLIRQVTFRVDCDADDTASERSRQFIEECLADMSQSFAETLSEILSMLTYGFSYHEIVYKQRQGGLWDGGASSKYNDGLIGWRKWPLRSQDTRWAWQFDDDGGIQGMWQNSPPTYRNTYLPIAKALLFRPRLYKNNPEGRSILRTAYRPWYFLKRMQEVEGIGVERDLAGFPVLSVPAEITDPNASADLQARFAAAKAMVTNVRRDALEGLVLPMAYDLQGMPLYDFKLVSTGGARQFNTTDIIQRYETRMAQSVLADWIMMGHVKVGTQTLSQSKIDVFTQAIGTWAQQIEDVVNRYAIPRLLALNGMTPTALPYLCHEEIAEPDLTMLGNFLTALSGAGMPLFPDLEIENHMRDLLKVPELSDTDYQAREAEQAAADRAQQQAAVAEYQRTRDQMTQTNAPDGNGKPKPPSQPLPPEGSAA